MHFIMYVIVNETENKGQVELNNKRVELNNKRVELNNKLPFRTTVHNNTELARQTLKD